MTCICNLQNLIFLRIDLWGNWMLDVKCECYHCAMPRPPHTKEIVSSELNLFSCIPNSGSSFTRLKKLWERFFPFYFSRKLNNFNSTPFGKSSLEMKIKSQMSRIRRKIWDGLFPTEQFFSKASFSFYFFWIKLKFWSVYSKLASVPSCPGF